jgi:hypothetical protein
MPEPANRRELGTQGAHDGRDSVAAGLFASNSRIIGASPPIATV